MGFFLFTYLVTNAQDKRLRDSLEIVYNDKEFSEKDELRILKELAESATDAEKMLDYSSKLIEKSKNMDSVSYLYSGFRQRGNAFQLKGDLTQALESFFRAAEIAENQKLMEVQGSINISIADVYSIMGDGKTSVRYYRLALELLKEGTDSINLASAQLNLGDEYYNQKKLDSALYYFRESNKIFKSLKHELGEAINLGNVGLVYAEKGENEAAEQNLNNAIEVLNRLGDYPSICVYLNTMSDIYLERKETNKALTYALRSLQLAEKYGFKDQISDSSLKLSSIYESEGDPAKSLNYFKNHIIYKDSVNNIHRVQEMANVRTEFEVAQKQAEVDLLNQQQKTQRIIVIAIGIALFFIVLFAVALFKRNKFITKTSKIIAFEKQRSDDLLKNILPDETALELKEKGAVQAKKFDLVSVLFTDFKGFTEYSESLNPEELVKSIDYYFSKFDAIIEKHGLEKIKTIGDAYMCAGGLPFPNENHPYKICLAAFEIVQFVNETKESKDHKLAKFEIRVGINTGAVVAGVVGSKKFSYDIWGDTVNVASRMESAGETGRVNISENTYKLLKDHPGLAFEPRGALEVKGKGKVQMYFVSIGKTL
jgi:class 3 adenylate cyclase